MWCPLTNGRKTGCEAELFLKNPEKYFEGFFSGVSRMSRVWGRHSPTRLPQGQRPQICEFWHRGRILTLRNCRFPSTADFAAIRRGRLGYFFRQYSDWRWRVPARCGFGFLLRTEMENAKRPLDFFITTTVAPYLSSKWLRYSFHHYYGTQDRFGQISPSLSTTTGMCGLPKWAQKTPRTFKICGVAADRYSIFISIMRGRQHFSLSLP